MSKNVLFNIFYNTLLMAIFVLLNHWAMHDQLEEIFVTLAIGYGFLVIVGNALFFLPRIAHT